MQRSVTRLTRAHKAAQADQADQAVPAAAAAHQVKPVLAAVLFLALAGSSHAITYTETVDAGQLAATAQLATGIGALDAIRGGLLTPATDRADLFGIVLTAGTPFSATTTASSIAFNSFDTTLFLFSGAGLGLVASDDNGGPQSTISFTPAASGLYYLGIAGAGYTPVSAGGAIFPAGLFGGGQVTATGPGAAQALSGWTSTTSEGDRYEIVLTGVTAVPEPSTAWLLLAGLLGSAAALRRR